MPDGSRANPPGESRLFARLEGRGPRFWTAATLGLAVSLGVIDYVGGPEIALSLVYAVYDG